MSENAHQPRLISEPESEYKITPEEQIRTDKYLQRLREYLKDPDFRKIPGFPIGDDEAILGLSDPPYYTACPNPFLPEIIEQWQRERAELRQEQDLPDDKYHREPFAADVSEGKNNPIYNAHSYHTKVPHPAIMRYILHYTDPGDIVFDGFCGTGMAGVAAQFCGDRAEVEKLGYFVDEQGQIFEIPGDEESTSRLGSRKAVLNDLSPAATFIAYNYNTLVDVNAFEREARRILDEVEAECGWMYKTWHPNNRSSNRIKGRINYTIWSDVFICPNCNNEMAFWDAAVNNDLGKINSEWNCSICHVSLSKNPRKKSDALQAVRAMEARYDPHLGQSISIIKQVPSWINYSVGNRRFHKTPDDEDIKLLDRIREEKTNLFFPTYPLMFKGEKWGDTWRAGVHLGISHTHHFFRSRSLYTISTIQNLIDNTDKRIFLKFILTGILQISSKQSSFRYDARNPKNTAGGILKGTLYIPSMPREGSIIENYKRRFRSISSMHKEKTWKQNGLTCIQTSSADNNSLPAESIDYIFVDPPFGDNLIYSELNFMWESWLGVFTHSSQDAVINKSQQKNLSDYQKIIELSFFEFFRILKPGRWMTIEFHNSKNAVWNAIQESLMRAGFVVADIRTLDKGHGSFKQVTTSGAVKQDLVISAYKPHIEFETGFQTQAGSATGAWAFTRQHLAKLPITVKINGELETLSERQAFLLFDRMVAFHIQRGVNLPLSAAQFYAGLVERFPKRDGMYFLPDQVPEYDRVRLEANSVTQLTLFVSDEKTAIQWLRQQLDPQLSGESQTYQDIQPKFLRQLHQAKHESLPELNDLLEQNFLRDESGRWYIPNPNEASDLERIRIRALLREFNQYLESKRRLKQFRTEAVRAGFADAWQRKDFETIVMIAERLPEYVLQEDPDLLMYYDNASLRAD